MQQHRNYSTNFFKLKNANILEKFVKNNDINNELLIQLNKLST